MPFTPAHAVVALPFLRSRRWSAAAVATGAVAPDLPLFLTGARGYEDTHALWAVPTLDVGLGLALLALWWGLIRPGLLAIVPARVRTRVAPVPRYPRPLLPVGVALGACSHVAWDAFTHRHRLGEALIPALGEQAGPFTLTSWLQYASGAGGLAVLAGAAVLALRTAAPAPSRAASSLGRAAGPLAAGAVVVPVVVAGAAAAAAAAGAGVPSVSGSAYAAATAGLVAAGASLGLIGVAVRIGGRPGPHGRAPAGA